MLEFLAPVVDHIPEPSQQTVRYWGYYANAARGKRRKAGEAGDTTQTPGRQDDNEFTRRDTRQAATPGKASGQGLGKKPS